MPIPMLKVRYISCQCYIAPILVVLQIQEGEAMCHNLPLPLLPVGNTRGIFPEATSRNMNHTL